MTKQLLFTALSTLLMTSLPSLRAEAPVGLPQDDATLTVRLYNYAGVSEEILQEAGEGTQAIYRRAGVETRWIECPTRADQPSMDPSCSERPGPHVIQMRIMPRASEALLESVGRLVYGYAMPSKTGGFGTIATIFWDRVRASAVLSKVSEAGLLGCVMAHEGGHLLLGMNSHSNHGLMSGRWEQEEFNKIAEGAFSFFGREKKKVEKNALARLEAAAR